MDEALEHAIAGRADDSEKILRSLDQTDPRVRFNLGWHDLRHGKFQQGFDGLNVGRFIDAFGSPWVPGTIWRDQDLMNKTLLLRGEGGAGDEIINFRFYREFQNMGAQVVVSCRPELQSLLSSQGVVTVSNSAIPYLHHDYWMPAMSAAYALGYDYDTLPGDSYLRVNAKPIATDKLKVGLRWGGNSTLDLEVYRKLPAQELINAASHPHIQLFSLQRDADQVPFFPGIDLQHEFTDWKATAEWVAGLDLVITSCTSIAHLAAALGVTTWVLVPVLPYYTWALPGRKSVWHRSVRLFRQQRLGSWAEPLAEIEQKLSVGVGAQ